MGKAGINHAMCIAAFLLAWPEALSCSASASPLTAWNWRHPLPQANPLNAVAFGAGRFVAAGYGGTVLTSFNGADWQRASVDSSDTFTAVAYGNGQFVAVNQSGGVFFSPNGDVWIPSGADLPGPATAIAFANTEFIAVTSDGWLARSSNLTAWTTERLAGPFSFTGVAYGDGTLVLSSIDVLRGSTWTLPRGETNWVIKSFSQRLFSAAWGGGKFVVVGNYGIAFVSTNGMDWHGANGFSLGEVLYGAVYGSSGYVVGGYTGPQWPTLFNSADGYNWQRTYLEPQPTYPVRSVAFGNGVYVGVGDYGQIITSGDGTKWTSRLIGALQGLKSVAWGMGRYVAVGDGRAILESPDGTHWSSQTAALTSATLSGVAFGNGRFVAVERNVDGKVVCSTNSTDWQVIDPGPNNGLWGVTFGDGMFVAVGANGTAFTSQDAYSWSSNYAGTAFTFNAVTFGGGIFVAVGGGIASGPSTLAYSLDTTNWTSIRADDQGPLITVAYGNGTFVAVGAISRLLYSTNGSNWSVHPSPVFFGRALAFGDGQFVLAGSGSSDRPLAGSTVVYSSTNGLDWTLRASEFCFPNLTGMEFHDGRFLAVGEQGAILQSDYAGLPRLAAEWLPGHQQLQLCVSVQKGSTYHLQSTTNLTTGCWQDESEVTNGLERLCVIQNVPSGTHSRFFRVISP